MSESIMVPLEVEPNIQHTRIASSIINSKDKIHSTQKHPNMSKPITHLINFVFFIIGTKRTINNVWRGGLNPWLLSLKFIPD